MAERFKAPREFMEASPSIKQAKTVLARLQAFNKKRVLIEQGEANAIAKQHESGSLTARERVAKVGGRSCKR